MRRSHLQRLSGALMLAATAWCAGQLAAAAQTAPAAAYTRCASACSACAAKCRACSAHCAGMIRAGMKEHQKSKSLSDDCGEICALAARICTRRGPETSAICTACAQACDACGADCRKYPDMKPMKDCAASCAVCEKACREMIQALKR